MDFSVQFFIMKSYHLTLMYIINRLPTTATMTTIMTTIMTHTLVTIALSVFMIHIMMMTHMTIVTNIHT